MKEVTKENLETFWNYYHGFHDSYIKNVKYDYLKGNIEIFIDVFWVGKPKIKEDGKYETNSVKMRMVCHDIKQYNYKEVYDDYINEAYLKFLKIKNKECLCFATDKENPLISVVCESIWYEEIQDEDKSIREEEIKHIHEEITKVYDYASKIYENLKGKGKLGYFNHHLILINKKFVEQKYYMPVISMENKGDICFNFDDVSYEFFLTREKLQRHLELLMEKFADKISIYSFDNCDVDLYCLGDKLEDVDKRLDEYGANEVMGITIDVNSFSDKDKVDRYLELINLFDGEK